MIQRRAVVGLALLSALLFCAFAVQSASAALSKNTTAFTCVKDGSNTGDFKDEHCDKAGTPGKEAFKHELIPVGTTTSIDGHNPEAGGLKSTVGLTKVEVACTSVKGVPSKSWQRNEEPEKGSHTFVGAAEGEFTGCTVKQPSKCTIVEPFVTKVTFHGVEGLTGPKGEENAMGVEYIGAGESETFGNLQFQNKGAEQCALKGQSFAVKGSVIGTSGPGAEEAQENKSAGATIVLNPKNAMQKMKLGSSAAEINLVFEPTMAEGGNPISITTTT